MDVTQKGELYSSASSALVDIGVLVDLIKNTDSGLVDSGFATQIVVPGARALVEM